MDDTLRKKKIRNKIDIRFLAIIVDEFNHSFYIGYELGFFDALVIMAEDFGYISPEEKKFILTALTVIED